MTQTLSIADKALARLAELAAFRAAQPLQLDFDFGDWENEGWYGPMEVEA